MQTCLASTESPRGERQRIWVNAESCGYGPAALAFSLYTQMRMLRFEESTDPPLLEFVGSRLALDFCSRLPWDNVHHIDAYTDDGKTELTQLFLRLEPRLVISVNDMRVSELLLKVGARVVMLDSVLWFWDTVPQGMRDASLLLTPNWIGLDERIRKEKLQNITVVPGMGPLLDLGSDCAGSPRKGVVINLGGLQTPFHALQTPVMYAKIIMSAIVQAFRNLAWTKEHPLTAFVNNAIREELQDEFDFLKTGTPDECRLALMRSRIALLTPGIGNICDAVDYGERVLFLPPISGSHGRQTKQIKEECNTVIAIGWHDLDISLTPINFDQKQASCFSDTQRTIRDVYHNVSARIALSEQFSAFLMGDKGHAKDLAVLKRILGRDDGTQIVKAIERQGWGVRVCGK